MTREWATMSVDPRQVRPGMDVDGVDGEPVGVVKAVRLSDFLVDRPLARDVYVPIDAVQAVVGETATEAGRARVILTVAAGRVDDMGWPAPPLH
jgi:hypothetical protein